MKKLGISISFFLISIGFANAQYFKTEDFDVQKKTTTVEHEERAPHFPSPEISKAEEDSLRALFSEENFKPEKKENKPENNKTGFIYPIQKQQYFLGIKPKKQKV